MSQFENRPNTGKLMKTKEKRRDTAPDMWGEIHFDRDYLRQLIDESEGLVTIKIDAWRNESAAGNAYLGIKVNTWKPDSQQSPKQEEKDPWDD
jgi:hypothetical protein